MHSARVSIGKISLTVRYAALAPAEALKYVVNHELCHLRCRDHSSRFWAQVGALYPDWKEQRDWLREKGHALKAELSRLVGS